MIKLLIVDDEPLIQVGIQSMLPWETHGIEICGTARNGKEALELIHAHQPEIVIADIKMPVMDGLELAKTCKEQYGTFPLFIILTSHEDFQLIKEAIHYDIIDYLIKLELTPSLLLDSISKAKKIIKEKKQTEDALSASPHSFFYDKFFASLLHNLFETPHQLNEEAAYLHLDFSAPYYVVAQGCFTSCKTETETDSDNSSLLTLYRSSLKMLEELIPQYLPCYLLSLGHNYFCMILCLNEEMLPQYINLIEKAFHVVFSMVHKYFNVTITASCGQPVKSPLSISESYQEARQIHNLATPNAPIIFFENYKHTTGHATTTTFNMSLFKEDIRRAFEDYDSTTLYNTLNSIISLFEEYPGKYLQAMDAACNILYLSLSLLPHGEKIITSLFDDYGDGYRSIYKQTSMLQVLNWLRHLRDGLCAHLANGQKSQTNKIVLQVKQYIDCHITEKLLLPEVASIFHITPNYLSLLFKKHSDIGFSEYISQRKIDYAKTLLNQGELKVYEIAEALGFESAFYFSKVFKKVEGCSPRDYKQYQ